MLRLSVLVLSIALLAPLGAATPTVDTSCPPSAGRGQTACIDVRDDDAGIARNGTFTVDTLGPTVDLATSGEVGDVDGDGPAPAMKKGTVKFFNDAKGFRMDVEGDDAGMTARNGTLPSGDPDFDLYLLSVGATCSRDGCSGSNHRNGTRPSFFDVFADFGVATPNGSLPGDPDFDLSLCCADLDSDGAPDLDLGAGCTPAKPGEKGAPPQQATCKWKIYAPLPGSSGIVSGGGDTAREQHGAAVFVFTSGAVVGCFATIDSSGETMPGASCFV